MARLLLGVTGSVAAIRTPALFEAICQAGHEVKVIATRSSLYFFDPAAVRQAGGVNPLMDSAPCSPETSPLTTHHSPLTTANQGADAPRSPETSPLTTHHSPLTTANQGADAPRSPETSPLTTHHSPLTTANQGADAPRSPETSPLTTHHSPLTTHQKVVIVDEDEWPGQSQGLRYQRGDPVLHIELRRWAEVLIIAPLDANTLAKLANGLADNCLTCVWRAWDVKRPVVLAPAMNTLMWEHPLTVRHLRQLAGDLTPAETNLEKLIEWINAHSKTLRIVPPVSKVLACGDEGMGAMASVEEIVEAVRLVTASRELTEHHEPRTQ